MPVEPNTQFESQSAPGRGGSTTPRSGEVTDGRQPGRHLPLDAALQRQILAAMRSAARPASYLGLLREMMLTSVHAAAYPLGLLPQPPLVHEVFNGWFTPRPVVLLHGWIHNRSAFLMMQRGLRRAGLGPLHTFEYPPMAGDLDAIARRLAPEVERLVRQAGGSSCVLIGHSMGGLIARQYVQELGGDRWVDTVVTLGTPHRGTYSAYCGFGTALQQCRPGSEYLQRLERSARPGLARWIAYYSDLDLMVLPAVSAKLTHPALRATNVRLHDIGHLSLLMSRAVLTDIIGKLDDHAVAA